MSRRGIRNQRGFTLIELLVVMLILGILAGIAYQAFISQTNKAHDTTATASVVTANKAARAEYLFERVLPNQADLIAAVANGEPELTVHAYNGGANPSTGERDISLTRDSADQVTVCAHSQSGKYFCLRSNETAALTTAAADFAPAENPLLANLDPTGLFFPDTAQAASGVSNASFSQCVGASEADTRACLADGSTPAHAVGTAIPGWGGEVPEAPEAPAPSNTALPTISGSTVQGDVLTGADGSWDGSPTSFDRQWQRCDVAGDSCSDIAGATASTYTLIAADVGSTIRFEVTASNEAGSASAVSTQTAEVTAPAPTPSSISGLYMWLKPESLSSLSNGAAVSTWQDSSGNGHDFTQANASERPSYVASSTNGVPAVSFSGGTKYLRTTDNPNGGSNNTLFIVMRQTSAVQVQGMWDTGPFTAGTNRNVGCTGSCWQWHSGGVPLFSLNNSGPNLSSGAYVFEFKTTRSGSNNAINYVKDGVNMGTFTGSGSAVAWNNPQIGRANSGGGEGVFNGQIHEILFYDRALSDSERQDVRAYINSKYGLSI